MSLPPSNRGVARRELSLMEVETKTCPHCAEIIRAVAKRCPRCRRELVKTTAATWIKFAISYILVLSPILIASWWLRDLSGLGESFDAHRSQIIVTNTTMHYSESGNTNTITVVGYLINESALAWNTLQIEAQFFDSNGKLVDTATEILPSQELPSHMTQAFRIRATAAMTGDQYASHKVFIRTAKDARKP